MTHCGDRYLPWVYGALGKTLRKMPFRRAEWILQDHEMDVHGGENHLTWTIQTSEQ